MATTFALTEPARDRIIRITNVHFHADEQFIVNIFEGFAIVDQFRTINTRTSTNSVLYILFKTIADRIRSTELNGLTIVDREIKIQPARNGNFTLNESETAFVRPATKKRSNRRVRTENSMAPETPGSPSATFVDSDFPALGPAPVTEDASLKAPAVSLPVAGNTTTTLVANETDFATAISNLTMTPEKDVEAQKDEHTGLRSRSDMREAGDLASARDAIFDIPKKAAQISGDRLKPFVLAQLDGQPANVNMNIPPAPANKNWNLNGHDPNDRSKNMITPDDWYNLGRNSFRGVEAEQKAKNTNVDRLVKDDGGFGAKDNEKFTEQ
ncbi:hypothetical protein HBH70_214040 [Parastagonospora nodorum]|nr:hypothetical protein HBH52_083260 [Parastagonospora nodorum]KAH4026999.1 hypothetical protein HBI09_146850 [Parastagonospora nodorum]KAH4118393.1 hypothetical protein HBH47_141570 [Parastagonospora nodorum]KAH4162650.1 hypothetical protein HBH43_162470 [Parastagonospora nodorum]KAH4227001.1 hypothetical protein HBI06_108550 [Parastagonospora nodorum]